MDITLSDIPQVSVGTLSTVNLLDQEEERLDKEIEQLQNELMRLKIDKRNILIAESILRQRELIDNQYSTKE
jgi:hypothetical protein